MKKKQSCSKLPEMARQMVKNNFSTFCNQIFKCIFFNFPNQFFSELTSFKCCVERYHFIENSVRYHYIKYAITRICAMSASFACMHAFMYVCFVIIKPICFNIL